MIPGQRAILKAAMSGDLESLKALARQDASLLSARDKDGSSLLHCAAWKGHGDIVAFLLDAGLPIDGENENGHWGPTPLCAAAHADHEKIVEFLIARGAEVNFRSPLNGLTPLGHTKVHNAKRAARVLLAHGAKE